MAAGVSYLDETLGAWRDVREGLIEEVKNIPAGDFEFRPTPEVRSVRELVQHILEVAMMMTGELSRVDTDLKRAPWPDLLAMYASAAYDATTKTDLVRLLETQMDQAERQFRKSGERALFQQMENFDGSMWTKFQWLHHGIAQEMYHRGQLTLYARLLGREPALTRRIRGE
ncbi:MAG: DinB family protein [Gemmatimonadota bacterium]|nr:DinB family protein [Gemmatimonadota bacterium]MDH3368546.1 DinB family protein [Gemmatimonadota bacterium]MDH3479627.1 DinB family protein [Gemmatimonadota bacterium]MDH3570341.1 DinB family protein [Gemmatimonadota bacterium]MDH5549488.1 DinB family protein [Gemmatimonadota bacterium]